MNRRIRVLIVDDSAVVRRLVTEALRADPEIEVVGTAADPYVARDRIKELDPDVLTLDLEMPRMDGLTFLRILMDQHPMPVVIMSSLSQKGSDYALEALRLGAFDVLGKPSGAYSFGDLGAQLIARVKAAGGARLRRPSTGTAAAPVRTAPRTGAASARQLILLGASTGGTEALREVLTRLPAGLPPIAVVQHIPPVFSKAFADRLSAQCAFEVREAADGDMLKPGLALIAPGNFHLMVQWHADHYRARVTTGPQIWHQRPAVDVLFKSAADCGAAPHAIAGVLTGMGKDGAEGLLRLRGLGAITFAQDEASCVVYGMPRAAWENGAAQRQIPLDRIADFIVHPPSPPPPLSDASTLAPALS
ncbi:protein-glutamate methylesterase/protein-glutamine glutaminase [Opitutus terrae]|uniref:Protein-glutamate methylesterase/protein-glutamine glutaminase n=1 Tax=Opitutus terrae (strain DSM 11246 / JCM 15787 / PB90-1) TaxID=452637 RepID=B1ZR52_OPITP|nr:chemotaxis response regulator protein-glutamate methylesterase [Opitutus terrae]ACB73719.1 response regulator receiver modulated CheB methylesterase [Opitutus terrae PB90-1]